MFEKNYIDATDLKSKKKINIDSKIWNDLWDDIGLGNDMFSSQNVCKNTSNINEDDILCLINFRTALNSIMFHIVTFYLKKKIMSC